MLVSYRKKINKKIIRREILMGWEIKISWTEVVESIRWQGNWNMKDGLPFWPLQLSRWLQKRGRTNLRAESTGWPNHKHLFYSVQICCKHAGQDCLARHNILLLFLLTCLRLQIKNLAVNLESWRLQASVGFVFILKTGTGVSQNLAYLKFMTALFTQNGYS